MQTFLKHFLTVLCLLSFLDGGFLAAQLNSRDVVERKEGVLRIIAFGAHPDDAEMQVGGSALLWGALGHETALVATTTGEGGHWREGGGPMALRRYDEAQKAAKIHGVKSFGWDIQGGEIDASVENRGKMIRAIRQWQADIVIAHRPNDYHPDHRYTGVLMQDCAFLVNVPYVCPDIKPLRKMPVFLYAYDPFQNPPFRVDIAVAIDDVVEKKLDALMVMETQFVEGGALGYLDPRTASTDPKVREELRAESRERFRKRFVQYADAARDKLIELYGQEVGSKVKYAEAFEVCEYGRELQKRALSTEEIRTLFPFIKKKEEKK
ncbi:MAG: PIG-L family deacetylase [Planctomycetaceae bacterium]|nr:PIG-L family deacetylase [Planctomycetaceae bacterium]